MNKNKNNCDCELCLYKTFPLDNPLLQDKDKIVEAIIYHFIFRLGNLVKSKKELNSHIIKFITMVNSSYLISSDQVIETINLLYKKIIDAGHGCRFSTNTTLTKHIQKETTYLQLIISSMDEKEVVIEKKEVIIEKKEVVMDEPVVISSPMEEIILNEIPVVQSTSYCVIS
jgi:hypothetical protein